MLELLEQLFRQVRAYMQSDQFDRNQVYSQTYEWLAAKKLRDGTIRSYEAHARLHYQPHIGHVRIDRLRVSDVASVFEAIDELNDTITEARSSGDPALRATVKGRRTVGTATKQRIRATLRSAITTYRKQNPGLLDVNAAALVDLPSGKRPKPLVWTGERVRAWQKDFQARLADARTRAGGKRVDVLAVYIATPRPSPVMVWTRPRPAPSLPARSVTAYMRSHLIAFRGLRRRAAFGLRRPDTDLDAATTGVRWQITQLGWATTEGAPKSDAGERHVTLDTQTITVLRAHRRRHDTREGRRRNTWTDTGFEFTGPDGTPLHPAAVTGQFEQLAYLAGLPRSACTICATSQPRCTSPPASTSRSSRTCLVTPPGPSPPIPTSRCCRKWPAPPPKPPPR